MKKNKTEEIEFIIDENNRVDFRQVLQMINMYEEKIQKKQAIINKAINNSQYWIDYYTRLNSDERIALRLQENIDILKEVE